MKKVLLFLGILFLSFSGVSLLHPQSVSAAEGGPASPSQGGPAGKIMLRAVSGPKVGEVTISWADVDSADNYHLVYGTDSKNLKYGVLNIGTSKVYTVKMLAPGTKYYFALVPVLNNVALYTSEWVSAWAMGGTQAVKPVTSVTSVTPVTPVTMMKPVAPVQTYVPVTAPAAGPVGKHWLVARSGPKVGEVTLTWRHMDVADNYHLVYGTEHGKSKYGALNIGWVNSFTVRNLVPGRTYHFALVPVSNGTALYTTDQVMTWAKMNIQQVVQTTPEAVMQPKVPSTQSPGVPGQ